MPLRAKYPLFDPFDELIRSEHRAYLTAFLVCYHLQGITLVFVAGFTDLLDVNISNPTMDTFYMAVFAPTILLIALLISRLRLLFHYEGENPAPEAYLRVSSSYNLFFLFLVATGLLTGGLISGCMALLIIVCFVAITWYIYLSERYDPFVAIVTIATLVFIPLLIAEFRKKE